MKKLIHANSNQRRPEKVQTYEFEQPLQEKEQKWFQTLKGDINHFCVNKSF